MDSNDNGVATEAPTVARYIDGTKLKATSTSGTEPFTDLKVIPVATCRTSNYLKNPKICEHTGVVAVMLSLRTAIGSSKNTTVVNTGGSRYVSGTGQNTRQRVSHITSANYDRIMTFADCSDTSGNCFAYMTHNKTQSVNFFDNLRVGQEGIGNLVLLEEIDPISDSLGTTTNVPLIKHCSHVLPLSGDMAKLVPSIPISAPTKGNTKYFCQHHVRDIQFGRVSIKQAICGGKLWYGIQLIISSCGTGSCPFAEKTISYLYYSSLISSLSLHSDRQLAFEGTGQSCGCFYKTDRHNPLVIEMTVTFNVDTHFESDGLQSIVAFRSYRTSRLFVAPDGWNALDPKNLAHEDALRKTVDSINEYICSAGHGGWTYIGWLRTGATTDQSDIPFKDAENIASLTQSPHISYLFPTNSSDIANDNAEFQRLRLHATTLLNH